MSANLACVGLAVADSRELRPLVDLVNATAQSIGTFNGVRVVRWQDPSGAALVIGWRAGEVADLLPTFAATAGGLVAGCCRLVNESVASVALVDADGEQLTAMTFEAEQYRQIKALGQSIACPARITALGVSVQVHADADAFAASPDSLLNPPPTQRIKPRHLMSSEAGRGRRAWRRSRSSPTASSVIQDRALLMRGCPAWSSRLATARARSPGKDSALPRYEAPASKRTCACLMPNIPSRPSLTTSSAAQCSSRRPSRLTAWPIAAVRTRASPVAAGQPGPSAHPLQPLIPADRMGHQASRRQAP